MKKFYFLFFITCLSCFTVSAQWSLLTSGSIAELRSVYFTNSSVGYVVGSDGTILKTTDGGTTWNLQSGTTDTLRSVFFTDDTTGYATGSNGTIIQTTDSGQTWTPLISGTTNLLRSICFTSHDTGYVAGGGGVILKTTDAGIIWTPLTSGTTQDLINIAFSGSDTGYAVSSLGTFVNGIVLKTTDAGNTWSQVYTDSSGLLGIAVKGDNVYAGGGSIKILHSPDAGSTWNQQYFSQGSVNNLRAMFFTDALHGFACGDVGTLLQTNDSGNTWNTSTQITINGLLGMYFPVADTGYAVGITGTILKYVRPCYPENPKTLPASYTGCTGDTVIFSINSVNGATSYLWNVPTGSTILTGQNDTLVTVLLGNSGGEITVAAVNNCGPGGADSLTLTVFLPPSPPVISFNDTDLISSVASSIQWYLNGNIIPGAINQNYTPLQNGVYTVVVTSGTTGCTAASAPYNLTNLKVREYALENMVAVYPNPAASVVHFNFSFPASMNVKAEVINVLGEHILTLADKIFNKGDYEFKIENHLQNGAYFLKITSHYGIYSKPFIILPSEN